MEDGFSVHTAALGKVATHFDGSAALVATAAKAATEPAADVLGEPTVMAAFTAFSTSWALAGEGLATRAAAVGPSLRTTASNYSTTDTIVSDDLRDTAARLPSMTGFAW